MTCVRSRVALMTSMLFSCGLALATAPSASAAVSDTVPAFCQASGPIVANGISAPLRLSTCPVQGRALVIRFADGHVGAGVHVPAPGRTEGNATLTTSGEYELSASNSNGYLTVRVSTPLAQPSGFANADAACGQSAFNLEGPYWYSNSSAAMDYWFYNQATAYRAGLSVSASTADVRSANGDLTNGMNNCGFAEDALAVHGAFQGNTGRFANVDSAGDCTSNFPDGQNTVSFGPLDSSQYNQGTHTGTLAVTCWIAYGSYMSEADTYLGSNVGLTDSLPSDCTFQEDLETIMTHEWGHVYGLAHETSGSAEVMYPNRPWCQVRVHLGLGDYDGLSALYGFG